MSSSTPSPGWDTRVQTRLLADGSTPRLDLESGKRHELMVHVPGGEEPGATVPESARATAGLSLPKVGEKWSTSAPTGSGSVSIAAPLPAARGLTPVLAIGYTTQGGNGPFGWGWRSSVPYFVRASTKAIVREHGRGLPEYDDDADSDVFVFSDAEELVKADNGSYKARVEGGFARIERRVEGGISHFVVRSAQNVLSIYGKSEEARVADPADPKRVFQWLLQEQRDDRGNVVVYRYKQEDRTGVDASSGVERGRGEPTQHYLKRILYGNRARFDGEDINPTTFDDATAREAFMFEVVLDYGEHAPGGAARADDDRGWPARPDAFSSCRAGFEIRTQRLCRRVLIFHRFRQLQRDESLAAVLVRSLDLGYDADAIASRLTSATLRGYDGTEVGELPPRTFTYSPRVIAADLRVIEADGLHELDLSPELTDAEFLDLDGVGVCGLVTREEGRFVVRPPTGEPGVYGEPAAIPFSASPSQDPAVHRQRFLDLGPQGRPALVEFGPTTATVYEREAGRETWKAAATIAAEHTPPVGKDPLQEQHRVYIADLDGDGIADVLVAKEGKYSWWRRLGTASSDGWEEQAIVEHDGDEDAGPGPVLFDATRDIQPEDQLEANESEAIVFADMTGDGLPDVVRLRADEVAYWPNLGYGEFGGKVVMDAAGMGEKVKTKRVRLCDVDGLGTTDILYLGENGATLWLNESGNRLVQGPQPLPPPFEQLGLSTLARLEGKTTGAFAFAEAVPNASITIVEFLREHPFLLTQDDSGFGVRTTVSHAPSSSFWFADRRAERPWKTRLPIVVPVVEEVVVEDLVAGTRFASSYSYSHGHYDPAEREFRGFGRVEQVDAESFPTHGGSASPHQSTDAEHFVAPLRTRSWFHTGAAVSYAKEYDKSDSQAPTLRHFDPAALGSGDDEREALRALRGSLLRSETYGDGGDAPLRARPIARAEHSYTVKSLQRKGGNHHASVLVVPEQTVAYTYERQAVPDPRLVQTAVLEVDDFGHPLTTATVAYPRRKGVSEPRTTPPRDEPDEPAPPDVVRARVTGFLFEEAKSFVLPAARNGLRAIADLYARHVGFRLLVVGHTDREGKVVENDALSLLRARSVAQFLRDDVEAWLAMYEPSVTSEHRFGAAEDAMMLDALGFANNVVGFQAAFGVDPDGDVGPLTRRALIRQYMDFDGTSLPPGTEVTAVGAGEHYPEVATADGVSLANNRRTELFLFNGAIDPPPPGPLLGAAAPQYAAWVGKLGEQLDVDAQTGIVAPVGGDTAEPPAPEVVDPDARTPDGPGDDPQLRTSLVVSQVKLAHQLEADVHRLGTVFEISSFEVSGKPGDPTAPFSIDALRTAALGGAEIAFEQPPDGSHQRRLLGRTRSLFYADNLGDAPLPLGTVGRRALPFETRQMAMSVAHVDQLFADAFAKVGEDGDPLLKRAGYVHDGAGWWTRSGRAVFAADGFFVPVASIDAFGKKTHTVEYDDDHFMVLAANDELVSADGARNRTDYRIDYRVLAPSAMNDPNNTTLARKFDALGLVIAEVTRGSRTPKDDAKPIADDPFTAGDEGDDEDTPTRRYEYDVHAFVERGSPVAVRSFVRIEHGRASARVALSTSYFAGSGALLQQKVRERSGKFRASGRTVVNNKGLPVLTFAPYISGSAAFEPGGATKLVATMSYDALGRIVRTDHPDGTHERVEHDAWHVESFDRNDTVLDSAWLAVNEGGSSEAMRVAAAATRSHANTPTHVRLDVLGRPVATFTRLRDDDGKEQVLATRTVLDVSGNVLEVIDPRGNVAEKREHGMLGQVLRTQSVDAGERRVLADATGAPLLAANGRGHVFRWTYDELRRPLEDYVIVPSEPEVLTCKRLYGDGANATVAANASLSDADPRGRHRGRLFRVYDGGGQTTILGYDMDGNVEVTERRLCNLAKVIDDAKATGTRPRRHTDWSLIGGFERADDIDVVVADERLLEERAFVSFVDYDALGRAILESAPSGVVKRNRYTEDGLLEKVERDNPKQTELTVAYEVESFDHLGRPLEVRHGRAAVTHYSYDELTERIVRIRTTAASGGKTLQDLHYAHDPIGNVTRIRDLAQQAIFFDNAKVEAVNDYRYDALYRLVEASGREHEGQSNARGADSSAPLRVAHPNDPTAMRRYVQRYRYDACGNLTRLVHEAGAGSFRRHYEYSAFGNRLRATGRRADDLAERYEHDAHGNVVAMPHLGAMVWNELDELERVETGTQSVFLQYAGGRRIRKLVHKGEGVVEDRIYLDGEEYFEKRRGGELVERTLTEHIAGGALRIETREVEDGKPLSKPRELHRHQLTNYLGSTTLEIDAQGKVISYEEYHPFGTTSYRATDSEIEVSPSRYRYTGCERDDETGLALHGARYYAPWLGRWTAADPSGLADGVNRFAYAGNRPVGSNDTTGLNEKNPWDGISREPTQEEWKARQEGAAGADLLNHPGGIGSQADADALWEARKNDPRRVRDWEQWGRELGEARDETSKNVLGGVGMLWAGAAAAVLVGMAGVAALAGTVFEGTVGGAALIGTGAGFAGGSVEAGGLTALRQIQATGELDATEIIDSAATGGLTAAAVAVVAAAAGAALLRTPTRAPSVGRHPPAAMGRQTVSAPRAVDAPQPAAASRAAAASDVSDDIVAYARSLQGSGDYPGVDAFRPIVLREGTIIYGGIPGQSSFYTTARSLRLGTTPESMSRGLQVRAHRVHGFRPGVRAYRVKRDVRVAIGLARANDAHGAGGFTQIVVRDYQDALEPLHQIMLKQP